MPKNYENNSRLIEIFDSCIESKNSRLFVLREDLIHPEISGNKWRKLKYNIQEAKNKHYDTILTFGGAYSNHIAATAAAGREYSLKTIGIIRGEENLPLNPTLNLANENGMELRYIDRSHYQNKKHIEFVKELKNQLGQFYLIPEGGSNELAVKGCSEIIDKITIDFDVLCCACGTGGTLAGIISSTNKKVIGFSSLKGGEFLVSDINQLLYNYSSYYNTQIINDDWQIKTNYHFGGYAKIKPDLIQFIQQFYINHKIKLDLVYTGKMLYGIFDLLKNTNELDNKTIIAIHTGGLQGNKGFEERFHFKLF